MATDRRACWGLIRRKEKWVLTWRARLSLLVLLAGSGVFLVRTIHDFLAVDAPVKSGVLVIEGWISEDTLTNFIANQIDYEMIYTTGGPTLTDRHSKDDSDTYASVARQRLIKAGVRREKIRMVPCWISRRDRTFAGALALREWCASNRVDLAAFNVVTIGPHARRSRLLNQKVFDSRVKIGVIALPNPEYEAEHWWRYSEGVKETLSETAAYLYSRFLFSPD